MTSFTECTKAFCAFFLLKNANVNEDTLGQMEVDHLPYLGFVFNRICVSKY